MSERRELATRLVMQEAVLKRLASAVAETRAKLAAEFRVGDAETAFDNEDHRLGRVRMNKARETWKVADRKAFLAWALEHRPDMVQTTLTVDPTFEAAVLKAKGEWIDQTTGEVIAPDGIEATYGAPTLTVERDEHADAMADALLSNPERLAIAPF